MSMNIGLNSPNRKSSLNAISDDELSMVSGGRTFTPPNFNEPDPKPVPVPPRPSELMEHLDPLNPLRRPDAECPANSYERPEN